MGFIDITVRALGRRPYTNLAKWSKKLAKNLVGYAWKNAKPKDLLSADVYDSVKKSIAGSLRRRLDAHIAGIETASRFTSIYVQTA